MLAVMYSSSGNINTGWVNEKYDELLDQAAVEMDDAKRLELYKEAETILFEEGPSAQLLTKLRHLPLQLHQEQQHNAIYFYRSEIRLCKRTQRII